MPKLNTYTSEGRNAVVNVASVSPESMGAQTGEAMSNFGRSLTELSDKLQQQRDDIDMVDRSAYFDQQLASKYQDILKDDSLRGETVQDTLINRTNALKRWARLHDEAQDTTQVRQGVDINGNPETMEIPPPSNAVRRALNKHIIQQASRYAIDMQADTMKAEANKQAIDLSQAVQDHVDRAVLQPWNEAEEMGQMNVLLGRARGNGIIPEEAINKMTEQAHDRFWRQTASTTPARMMQIQAEYLSNGKVPPNMDQSKVMEYGNIAVGRLNARDKQDQADIKELQDKNHARLTAQAIRGELDRSSLADIVDRRGVDADKAMSLVNLNDKIKEKQREENFIDGRTPQIETRLLAMKYNPKTTSASVEAFRQTIFDERMKDHISQRDFEHLNSLWQGLSDHVNKDDTTGKSASVTHAHEVLNRSLAVTGPMGFDSLGNQVQASAALDFYREVERDQNANPMDIAEKVIKRYKPIIEQRIKLGEKDQNSLDDAKMSALAQRGGISKAALQAWKDAQQQKQGQRIVDDTLQSLPPPQEPSWFDTIKDKVGQVFSHDTKPAAAPSAQPAPAKPKMRK